MNLELLLQTLAALIVSTQGRVYPALSVGCFVCSSYNGSNPNCHDPFNPVDRGVYHKDCKTGVPGRQGLFPAHFCVKMSGRSVEDDMPVIVRTCSTQNMGHNCGFFSLEKVKYKGCLTTCTILGCNAASSMRCGLPLSLLMPVTWVLAVQVYRTR